MNNWCELDIRVPVAFITKLVSTPFFQIKTVSASDLSSLFVPLYFSGDYKPTFITTVFPRIVSAETILFLFFPYVL